MTPKESILTQNNGDETNKRGLWILIYAGAVFFLLLFMVAIAILVQ